MIQTAEGTRIRQIVLLKIAGPVFVVFFLYVATAFAVWGFETSQNRDFENAFKASGLTDEEYMISGCDECPREPNIKRPDDALWW